MLADHTDRTPVTVGVRASRRAQALGRLYLRLFGWRVAGTLPACPSAVVIAAPHTTNWDLPFMLAVAYALGVQPAWLGKRELFRWPFGGMMRWLGGLAVDRTERRDMVRQAVDRLTSGARLFLVIPPSGTRRRAEYWKSGFYHIARGAEVPIVCAYLDYTRKVGGVGLAFTLTGDVVGDMGRIRAFYAPIRGRFPEQTTPVRLREEDSPVSAAGGA
jgi:1-acyl-sn-glycerol-3-phosphate acyltransferase